MVHLVIAFNEKGLHFLEEDSYSKRHLLDLELFSHSICDDSIQGERVRQLKPDFFSWTVKLSMVWDLSHFKYDFNYLRAAYHRYYFHEDLAVSMHLSQVLVLERAIDCCPSRSNSVDFSSRYLYYSSLNTNKKDRKLC